ncbi:hypothetical protein L3X38_004887 [Prunus dulcis]|uniref:P-loop containing nucleoside triphosphate hydrolases superfamily protein n=1 Tax=Prunus dulcis TaxID=3755 RepID=A0AAD4ZPY9_PRUDU|nr:hypothetical protein L3X38_004887 [Prunus dulcis]
MFSLASRPSTTSALSTYTTFAAGAMLLRTVINEVQTITSQFIPQKLQDKILATIGGLLGILPNSQMTLIIDEHSGLSVNEIYQASAIYLSTRITPSIEQLKVSKAPSQNNFSVTINRGEKLIDEFEGIKLRWEFCCTETKSTHHDYEYYSSSTEVSEHRPIEKVLSTYLPYVVDRSNAIQEERKVVKLHALGNFNEEVLWKRGYLLYGPPGTGKSSLIAAMANYLRFDIYDLELTHLHSNSELRRLLVSTANRSILVIEDLDCSIELKDREFGGGNPHDSQDKLDPALLRPGRMDMHIHMSCTPGGFKILASNYLGIKTHGFFDEIEASIREVEVTPAEIAEELMKSEDTDTVLGGLVAFLKNKKKVDCNAGVNVEETKEVNEQEK